MFVWSPCNFSSKKLGLLIEVIGYVRLFEIIVVSLDVRIVNVFVLHAI